MLVLLGPSKAPELRRVEIRGAGVSKSRQFHRSRPKMRAHRCTTTNDRRLMLHLGRKHPALSLRGVTQARHRCNEFEESIGRRIMRMSDVSGFAGGCRGVG